MIQPDEPIQDTPEGSAEPDAQAGGPPPQAEEVAPKAEPLADEDVLSKGRPLEGVRSVARAVQHMVATGLLALVMASMIQFAIATRILLPYMASGGRGGQGFGWQLLAAGLNHVGLVVSLPVVAWALAWIFDDRPVRLAFGSVVLAHVMVVFVDYLSAGLREIVPSVVEVGVRVLAIALTTWLGALAYSHGRAKREAREAKHRRGPAPLPEAQVPAPTPPPEDIPDDELEGVDPAAPAGD